jgi:4-amino-4-deoxy-L-arabinose transferase-like glycosyltransferase
MGMDIKPDDTNTPPQSNRWLIFISVFLTILGQILLYTTPVNHDIVLPPAMLLTILGVFLFLVSLVFPNFSQKIKIKVRWTPSRAQAWGFTGLCFSIMATIAMIYFEKTGLSNHTAVVTLWLFSGLCYVGGFFNGNITRDALFSWLKEHKTATIQVSLVTLLAFALRFYQLGDIPRVVNGDEARIGIVAMNSFLLPGANPFGFWENIGNLYLHLINAGISIFGVNPLGLRLMAALGGLLAIPATYLLARQIAGHRIALVAATLLAFTHTHLHFSRTVAVSYIQGTWLTPLALYFLLSGLKKHSNWRTALAGCLVAVHAAVYLDAQIIAGVVFAYMLIALVFLRPWFKTVFRQALAFWGGLGIMILPAATYFWSHPQEFMNRLNAEGTFQSGWLANEVVITGNSEIQILLGRVVHAFLSLIYYPAFDFYGSPVPILSLISSSLFLLGMGIALLKTKQQEILLLNGYFWGTTVAIAIFSIPPTADSYRMLIAIPPALIMLVIGLDYLLESFGAGWQQSRKTYIFITTAVLTSLLVFNIWAYFFEFAGRCLYGGDSPTRFASYLGNYARTVDRESDIYLLSDDHYAYGTHASVDFLGGRRKIINIPDPVSTIGPISGETIIANPSRIEELEAWIRTRPGGEIHYLYDCEEIILLAYQLP